MLRRRVASSDINRCGDTFAGIIRPGDLDPWQPVATGEPGHGELRTISLDDGTVHRATRDLPTIIANRLSCLPLAV
jgi:hypothetical protein